MKASETVTDAAQVPSGFLVLADVNAVPLGLSFWRAGGHEFVVVRTGDCFFALDDSCPHQGASLSGGTLTWTQLQCRAHGLKFDVATGKSAAGSLCVKAYATRVVGNQLLVQAGG